MTKDTLQLAKVHDREYRGEWIVLWLLSLLYMIWMAVKLPHYATLTGDFADYLALAPYRPLSTDGSSLPFAG